MSAFTAGNRTERKPIFGRYGLDFKGNSPGRGELRRGRYGDAIIHKVRKRKRLERDYAIVSHRRGGDDESDSEEDSRPSSRGKGNHTPTKQGWFGSILDGINSRPALPHILSFYPQILLHFFGVFFVVYGVWCFASAVRADIERAASLESESVLAEMALCSRQYVDNKCAADQRVPAMETICNNWEECMNKDPLRVARARLSAHTFAEIFNSFVEPISWKAMVRLALTVILIIS